MNYDNRYNYPYNLTNDRYLSIEELPFIKRLARMMYINSLSNNYSVPQNSFFGFMRERMQNTGNNGRF